MFEGQEFGSRYQGDSGSVFLLRLQSRRQSKLQFAEGLNRSVGSAPKKTPKMALASHCPLTGCLSSLLHAHLSP